MTHDDARKVAAVARAVDGGCGNCVYAAAARLAEAFPDFDWPALIAAAPWESWDEERYDETDAEWAEELRYRVAARAKLEAELRPSPVVHPA